MRGMCENYFVAKKVFAEITVVGCAGDERKLVFPPRAKSFFAETVVGSATTQFIIAYWSVSRIVAKLRKYTWIVGVSEETYIIRTQNLRNSVVFAAHA